MKDVMFDNWINAQAANYATCDQIVSEKLRVLDEEDVVKRSADTRFIDMWVDKEVIQGDPEYDEEDETEYHLKDCSGMVISHPGRYKVQFGKAKGGDGPIDLEKIVEDSSDYLKTVLHNSDNWSVFCQGVKFDNPSGYAVGCLLEDFHGVSNEDDSKDPLKDAQKVIAETFEFIKNYDAQGFTQFIHKKGIQIDDRKGTIYFSNDVLGGLFEITLYP